jgi:twitching motility protein PilT
VANESDILERINRALQDKDGTELARALAMAGDLDSDQFYLTLMYKVFPFPKPETQKRAAGLLITAIDRNEKPLRSLVTHADDQIRYWALHVLGQTNRLSLDELEAVLGRSDRDETKTLAADFLFAMGTPEAHQILICQLGNPSWNLRHHINKLLLTLGEAIVPPIREVFVRGDLHQKYGALRLLVEVLGPNALKYLRKFLTSKNPTVRLYAIAALEFIPGSKSLGLLFASLMDKNPIMRHQACHVLARRGQESVDELKKLVNEQDTLHQEELLELIGRILGTATMDFVDPMLNSEDPNQRYFALVAIGQQPNHEGLRKIIEAFFDPVWVIRNLAARLLSRLGPAARDELIATLNSSHFDTVFWATRALGEAGDSVAARPLLNLVDHHPDPNVRVCAVKALCRLDIEYIAELLVQNFKDSVPTVRNAIIEGLTTMTRTKVVKTLLIHLFHSDQTISFCSEKTLKLLDLPALSSVFELLVTLAERERERFIRYVHLLKPEQLEVILRRPKVTLDDFDPDRLDIQNVEVVSLQDYRNLDDLLIQLKEQGGSDLHINVGLPPMFRIHGELTRANIPPVTEDRAIQLLQSILNEDQRLRLKDHWEIDFSYELKNVGRYRGNIFRQRQGYSGVFRLIPTQIPTFEELGLNRSVFEGLADHRSGLILLTGTTGSGKSTTMATMVDYINQTRFEHILTIEDPIEFVHQHKRCSINQRELGVHTHSFSDALRSSLRENPDVILVGEMRDPETIKLALTASETGHLVFSTLHTINTSETVNRIIGAFAAEQQEQVRLELSGVLRAIISQKLIQRKDRRGRMLAYEMLICNTAVRNLIKEAKTEQIISIIQSSQAEHMQTMDQSLAKLVVAGACDIEIVMPHVSDKKSFQQLLQPPAGGGTAPKPGAGGSPGTAYGQTGVKGR